MAHVEMWYRCSGCNAIFASVKDANEHALLHIHPEQWAVPDIPGFTDSVSDRIPGGIREAVRLVQKYEKEKRKHAPHLRFMEKEDV